LIISSEDLKIQLLSRVARDTLLQLIPLKIAIKRLSAPQSINRIQLNTEKAMKFWLIRLTDGVLYLVFMGIYPAHVKLTD